MLPETGEDGKEKPVQKPVDADGEFTTKMLDSYRLTNSTGIFDNHKQRFFDTGSVKVTHLDENWVCGEINLSHAKEQHALTGTFAAQLPPETGVRDNAGQWRKKKAKKVTMVKSQEESEKLYSVLPTETRLTSFRLLTTRQT